MKYYIILSILIIILISLIVFRLKIFSKLKQNVLKRNLKNVSIDAIDALKGYDFELFISTLLQSFGFTTFTTSKSGDKGADIIAKNKSITIAIQAKLYYNNKVGTHAVQEIYTAREYYKCGIAMLITNSSFTNQAIDIAKRLNVLIIDRDELINLMKPNGKIYFENYLKSWKEANKR